MDTGKLFRRSLAAGASLIAMTASSAVNERPGAGHAVASLAERLHSIGASLEGMLNPPPQAGAAGSVWMALLALACMAVVVKRKNDV